VTERYIASFLYISPASNIYRQPFFLCWKSAADHNSPPFFRSFVGIYPLGHPWGIRLEGKFKARRSPETGKRGKSHLPRRSWLTGAGGFQPHLFLL